MDRLRTILRTQLTGALGFCAFVVGYLDMTGELDALPQPWPRIVTFVGALLAWLGFSPMRAPATPAAPTATDGGA
jgi:hypothetical protein